MKKLLLFMAVVALSFSANAQNFSAGVSGGIPTGDFGDAYSFTILVEVSALWDVSDVFDAGVTAGYSNTSLKSEFDGDSVGFLPIAAAARFNVSDAFSLEADLGYAIGISPDGNDGGFYYAPKLLYGVTDSIDIVASYRGVSLDGSTFNTITLGVDIGL